MDIYLMQHGVATSAEDDPSRPLTAAGRASVERVAAQARTAGVRADRCVHSGKLRAEQTARVLADAVGATVQTRAGLNPSDPVRPIADWLQAQARVSPQGSIAVVGHLPFLDRLTSLLVAGDDNAHAVRFQNAALMKLVPKDDAPGYAVAWILSPDLA
ncbi:MAG: phosphohistidine phosphatase SixA [Propionicimonas sp.]